MSTIIENLHAMRTQIDAMIASANADGSGATVMVPSKTGKSKKVKVEKKERANKGQKTAWGEFTRMKKEENQAAIDAYTVKRVADAKAGTLLYTADQDAVKLGRAKAGEPIPENKAKVGAHLSWMKEYKSKHEDEWQKFKSTWEAEHPKGSSSAEGSEDDAASVAESAKDSVAEKKPKKRGAIKDSERTPEDLARVKAERAAKKAAKTAKKEEVEEEEAEDYVMEAASPVASVAAPVAVPVAVPEAEAEEESEDSLIPFTHKKVKYLRFGHLDEDGEGVWHEDGDLWMAKADGTKGPYAGQLLSSGKINAEAEEPEL